MWGGAVIVGLILIGLLWPAKAPAPTSWPRIPPARPAAKFVHHLKRSVAEVPAPVLPLVATPAETNAASIYRQAFALYDALSKTNKDLLSNWQTNIDAAVAADICEQLRPICDLLHQASTVTNCDWGIGLPLEPSTKLPHLAPARALGRAVIWSAAHCRLNDAPAATEDLLATLRLGQQVSHGAALIGYLVDMALQQTAWSFIAANLDRFTGADSQRIASALDDLAYDDAFSRAMEQEADSMVRFATKLATQPPADAAEQMQDFTGTNVDLATSIAGLKQEADLVNELVKVLADGSDTAYEAWLQHYNALAALDPLVKTMMPFDTLISKAQSYEVNRALVEAGLAVAANGPAGLAARLDPSTGEPFTYRAVPGGFELQSNYQVKNQPLKMYFPQSATQKEIR